VGASNKNPKDLPTAEQVLFAALRMFHNQAAIARMTEGLGVSPVDAESALAKLPNAAIAIAAEKRMTQFRHVANRILPLAARSPALCSGQPTTKRNS
jgi:hypothetical protein